MNKNALLYNSAFSLVKAASIVKFVDKDFANYLLDKAVEYKNQIKLDENLEEEVKEFERKIRERL